MSEMQTFTTKIQDLPDLIPIYVFDIYVGDKMVTAEQISVPIKSTSGTTITYEGILKIKKSTELEEFFNNINYPIDLDIKLRRDDCWSKGPLPIYWKALNVTKAENASSDDYLCFNYDNFEMKNENQLQ